MSRPTLLPHQSSNAERIISTIAEYGLAYDSSQERTGKTLTALEVAERLPIASALVITTKKAMDGWCKAIESFSTKNIEVINYHSVHKLPKFGFDFIILDEAHKNISMCGKVGTLWKSIRPITRHKNVLYLSATPNAQSMGQLFNQLALCDYSPFKRFKSYFDWHRSGYGVPTQIRTPYGYAMKWDVVDADKIWSDVKHLFHSVTRQEVGHAHEAKDVLHALELPHDIAIMTNALRRDGIYQDIVCESGADVAIKLHQLSGGTIKGHSTVFHTTKVDYIREHFGECERFAILHQYIAEGDLLSKAFPLCPLVGQITRFAEGVDLSHLEGIIIYSMNWSVATYSQSRNRCCNINRDAPINIHYLLAKNSIDERIYESVAIKKKDFEGRLYATK